MHSNSFINSIDAINLISFLQFWQFHQFLLILIPSLISLIAIIHITALPTHPTKSLRKIRKNLHNRQTFFTTAGCDSCNNYQLWFHLFVFFSIPMHCITSKSSGSNSSLKSIGKSFTLIGSIYMVNTIFP